MPARNSCLVCAWLTSLTQIYLLIHSFICSLNHSSSNSLIHSFTHSFFCLYHLCIYPFIYSLIHSSYLFSCLLLHPFIHLFILFWVICSFFYSCWFIHFSDIFWHSRGEAFWAWFLGNTEERTGSGAVLRGWTYSILWDQKILDFCSPLWSDVMTLGGRLFTILCVYSLGTVPGSDQKFFFGQRKWLCSISCWGRMGRDGSDIKCSWPRINQLLKAGPFCKGASI